MGIETRLDVTGHRRRWRDVSDPAGMAVGDQKVPGGAYWLPPAAPVAQGAYS